MKWILAVLAAMGIAALVFLQMHSVKTTYVNGLAPYTSLPGLEFIVERDCYIFKFKDHDTDWPLLGAVDTVPDLPAEVKTANVGAEFPKVRILDVVRVGERFRIVSVRRDVSRSETRITFEVLLQDESTRKYPRVDAYWILDHSPEKTGGAPKVLAAYAVPLRRD